MWNNVEKHQGLQRQGVGNLGSRTLLWLFNFVLLAGLCCVGASNAAAQTTSTIAGTVTDKQGLAVSGAQVKVEGKNVVADRTTTTDASGEYNIPALPAGVYDVTVTKTGFRSGYYKGLDVALNHVLRVNVTLEVGMATEQVEVSAQIPLLDTQTSTQSTTITPQQIVDMPINGRNYLDLMQLVPGVAINRQADAGSDNATNVLGERGGNTNFLIDGQPNRNEVSGGASSQFNQETIAEFEVITTGYKAEFGHASGGVVNVITKSGTNDLHGVASAFHRNNAFDSSDIPNTDVPYLLRWDYSLAAGGKIIPDKMF